MAESDRTETTPQAQSPSNPDRRAGSPPPEYLRLVRIVVDEIANDETLKSSSAASILSWIRSQELSAIQDAVAVAQSSASGDGLLHRMVATILKETHHPLLSPWTPAQIHFWLSRIRLDDVELSRNP